MKHGHVSIQPSCRVTDDLHKLGVVFMRPVGEVETHHVHAGTDQFLNSLRRRGGGAYGGNNLYGAHGDISYSRSPQVGPILRSTFKGTLNSKAEGISSKIMSFMVSIS